MPSLSNPGSDPTCRCKVDAPQELGADRLCDAVAAYAEHGGPCLVLDFGTAVTWEVVSAEGEYLGGVIAPGPGVTAEAFSLKTAKLPSVAMAPPPRVIGKGTVDSIQSGLFYGYLGLIEGVTRRILDELGEATVVATGGLAQAFASHTDLIQHVEPDLTLHGLRILWQLNREGLGLTAEGNEARDAAEHPYSGRGEAAPADAAQLHHHDADGDGAVLCPRGRRSGTSASPSGSSSSPDSPMLSTATSPGAWTCESLIGAYLDPIADKMLITVAYIALTIPLGQEVVIPLWLTILALFRDFVIMLVAGVLYIVEGLREFPPSPLGKATTFAQVVTIAVVLLANVTPVPWWIPQICFYGSFALVIVSAFNYIYRVSRFVDEARLAKEQEAAEDE